MSTTHPHAVLTDAPGDGRPSALPRIFQHPHALVARAMNARLGRGGPFFGPARTTTSRVHGGQSLEEPLVDAAP